NALDFDDLLMETVLLFDQEAEVLEEYRRRYIHLLIDEFQDTNVAQYVLARQLASHYGNICVVGDPDQSIYTWRAADLRNILNFQRDFPEAKVVTLEQNYRSTQGILEVAHHIISHNRLRLEKRLWTDKGPGMPAAVYEAYDEEEEAAFVASEAEKLLNQGYRPNAFAVLYRVNAQSRPFEEVFVRRGIPYRLVGGLRFYERKEVKDVLAYLRLLHNPADGVALARIINTPPRGIGPRTLEELLRWARSLLSTQPAPASGPSDSTQPARASGPPVSAQPTPARAPTQWGGPSLGLPPLLALAHLEEGGHPFRPSTAAALRAFHQLMVTLKDALATLTLPELIDLLLERISYRAYLLAQGPDGEERWENMQELLAVAAQYEGMDSSEALEGFLAEAALMSDVDEYDEKAEAVTLITLHQAKGLEFPVVFVVGMEEGQLPHNRSLDDPEQVEEERRLCYVGITRAQERLYLVRAFRRGYGHGHRAPSRFLKELPPHLLAPVVPAQPVWAPRPPAPRPDGSQEPAFAAGDRVLHAKFGQGVVVSCTPKGDDQEVVVAFEGVGVKKLLLSFAALMPVPPGPAALPGERPPEDGTPSHE
ncbi:MAG TPA: 3'-5' exonuclease, partial [Dehalococcoidia bacterium]|nr:3'-5' exonuclease [Dehalococcoidia bacterium]